MSDVNDRDLMTGAVSIGHRPALIVVDMSVGFTSPESPLGGDFQSEVAAAGELVAAMRASQYPVYFSTVVYDDEETASVFRSRLPDLNILQRGSHWVEIDERLGRPNVGEVVEKAWPSAFFATSLADMLQQQAVDTVIVCGLTTSGCVRATAVDGLQNNYPTIVVPEACGDRNRSAHAASLHDIHAKYGLVQSLTETLSQISKGKG